MNRVGRALQFTATLAVAIGTFISAFWILAANNWMHTPTGRVISADGQFVPADWLAVIFNTSFPYRLVHTVFAASLTTALVVVAALAQGITLGAPLQGIAVQGRGYAGGWFDWLTPFSLLVGASLVCGYALLGAAWLIMKSEGALQARCYRLAFRLGIGTILAMAAVSASTPFLRDAYWPRWFAWPQVLFIAQVPLLGALALFTLGLSGLGISLYSLRRAAGRLDLGCRRARRQLEIHAARRTGDGADHPRLHRLFVLGVPRQDRKRGLSLSWR